MQRNGVVNGIINFTLGTKLQLSRKFSIPYMKLHHESYDTHLNYVQLSAISDTSVGCKCCALEILNEVNKIYSLNVTVHYIPS